MKLFQGHFKSHPYFSRIVVVLLPFAAIPLFDRSAYHMDLLASIGIYVLLAMGLNVCVGMTGLLNLGYAAFFAIGAYTYALLNLHWNCPFWVGLIASGIATTIFGLIIGLPTIRVKGDYLAITTLGFGEIVRIAFNNLDKYTGGPNGLLGIARPSIHFPTLSAEGFTWHRFAFSVDATSYVYLALVLIGLTAYCLFRLMDTRLGRALVAIREDELAASCMGVAVLRVKLTAFAISSFIAGLAGCLFAAKQTIVTPDSFDFIQSVLILAMVVLGGLGNIWGAALGALILGLLPELLREFATYRMLIFGLLMIAVMLFRPQGILGNQVLRRQFGSFVRVKKEQDHESS